MRNGVFVLLHVNKQDPYPTTATGVVAVYETRDLAETGRLETARVDLSALYERSPELFEGNPALLSPADAKALWQKLLGQQYAYRIETASLITRFSR